MLPIKKITFCISTNGKDIKKTDLLIRSILDTHHDHNSTDIEIIIAGDTSKIKDYDFTTKIDAKKQAHSRMLAALRCIAAEKATGDVIVFCDDDLLFPRDWLYKFHQYSSNNQWSVLSNRILLPNGGRYWDRAITKPHKMVDYDHDHTDTRLYQCGCFWIVTAKFYWTCKWDETIPFYAEGIGGVNEDIEYSRRVYASGNTIKFDTNNMVWHNDKKYVQTRDVNKRCILISNHPMLQRLEYICMESYTERLKQLGQSQT